MLESKGVLAMWVEFRKMTNKFADGLLRTWVQWYVKAKKKTNKQTNKQKQKTPLLGSKIWTSHLELPATHDLHEPLQSAYKRYHSTETALLKVYDDIIWAMERKGVTILLLLDWSSAFDTIDHKVLITRLHNILGVDNIPLAWFESYLRDRSQCVYINGSFSSLQHLSYGVPQGSVLGPLLFSIYILPIGAIIRRYGLEMHVYADDTQIYVSVCPTTADGVRQALLRVEQCVMEIQKFMSNNFLKLKAEKTEILIFGFRAQLAKFSITHVQIAGVDIPVLSKPIKNLGVMFDSHLSMSAQVANIIKPANFQLVNIGRARKLLTTNATKLAVHTLGTGAKFGHNFGLTTCDRPQLKLLLLLLFYDLGLRPISRAGRR